MRYRVPAKEKNSAFQVSPNAIFYKMPFYGWLLKWSQDRFRLKRPIDEGEAGEGHWVMIGGGYVVGGDG